MSDKKSQREILAADVQPPSRRQLFTTGAAALGAAVTLPSLLPGVGGRIAYAEDIGPESTNERQQNAYQVRRDAAAYHRSVNVPPHPDNGDEARYPNHIAMFHKSLPHDSLGFVDGPSYAKLIKAIETGADADWAAVPTGPHFPLVAPRAAYAYVLLGADSHELTMPPAPTYASAETAGEAVECYWQALARDIPFSAYDTDPTIAAACADLSALSDFRGPKQGGAVTPQTIFRGIFPGDTVGPYISQFLYLEVPHGQLELFQRYRTRIPGYDNATTWLEFLSLQRGESPTFPFQFIPIIPDPFADDPVARYLRNGRDLAEWVHIDWAFQAPLNAALIMARFGRHTLDVGNPYVTRTNQTPFVTFGVPHITALLGMASDCAFKACWYQKWPVHRRLRPEHYAAHVHHTLTGVQEYPVHADALNSSVHGLLDERFGGFLLPQAYKEGCPAHPAYPSGHATVIGACVTVLKAFFKEDALIDEPEVPDAEGLNLVPYTGTPLTIGGELNKLASNVAIGRDHAGIHWRTDAIEGILLGERVAIEMLRDLKNTYKEPFGGYSLTKFDGTTITI